MPLFRKSLPFIAGVLFPVSLCGAPPSNVRFATYNVSFFRSSSGALAAELDDPAGNTVNHQNIRKVAEVLQRIRPDVLLLNEFDYDPAGLAMDLFAEEFLAQPQQASLLPLEYPYRISAPSNTGISSGFDLDNNGSAVTVPGSELYGNDSFGFGTFPGQYGMVVYSRYPIDEAKVRSWQQFLWKDLPNSQLVLNSGNPPLTSFYSVAERDVFRLSSKTHLDVPIDLGGGIVAHFLVSHPTPPTFDGPENRNGKRNYDEIRLWADYIDPARSGYLVSDQGTAGGLSIGTRFVIAGDQNADPNDGDTVPGAARQLTLHPLINATRIPSSGTSGGGAAFSGGTGQTGNKVHDTAAFSGGLRVDYVLPSRAGFTIFNSGVFWPGPADPLRALVNDTVPSDHHAVWVDLQPVVSLEEALRDLVVFADQPGKPGGSLSFQWQPASGYVYDLQRTAGGNLENWESTGLIPALDPQGNAGFSVPAEGPGRQWYRISVSFSP